MCREAEVLSMFAKIIDKLEDSMAASVPQIFAATFECTLNMIKGNYVDFPEHRLQFFSLLQAITNHCFSTLKTMSSQQQGLLIDSIVWAFRHTERNVADTGLQLLSDMLDRFAQERDLLGPFFQAYYLRLMQEIFAVLTDTMHKPGFRLQVCRPLLTRTLVINSVGWCDLAATDSAPACLLTIQGVLQVRILSQLIGAVKADMVAVPLWPEGQTYSRNADFVRAHLLQMLATSFPNMTQAQVQSVVSNMFDCVEDFTAFKNHCRDFLVQTKEFGAANNEELYADERADAAAALAAAIPGLTKPADIKDEMGMDD